MEDIVHGRTKRQSVFLDYDVYKYKYSNDKETGTPFKELDENRLDKYVEKILFELQNGSNHIIFISIEEEVRNVLKEKNIDYITISFDVRKKNYYSMIGLMCHSNNEYYSTVEEELKKLKKIHYSNRGSFLFFLPYKDQYFLNDSIIDSIEEEYLFDITKKKETTLNEQLGFKTCFLEPIIPLNNIERIEIGLNEIAFTQDRTIRNIHIHVSESNKVYIYTSNLFNLRLTNNSKNLFSDMTSLKSVYINKINFFQVNTTEELFKNCIMLEEVTFVGCNFTNVTNVKNMFQGCANFNPKADLTFINCKNIEVFNEYFI